MNTRTRRAPPLSSDAALGITVSSMPGAWSVAFDDPQLEGLEDDYQVEATSSPSGVMHVTFTRAGV